MMVKLPGSGTIASSTLTSCILPSETWTNDGILPRRSICVCIFTAALVVRKRHAQILIEMGECLGRIARWIACDTSPKSVQWKEVHELCENKFAVEHCETPRLNAPVSQIKVQVGDTPKTELLSN